MIKRATMSPTGRLTMPVEARRALQLEGEADFEWEVIEGKIVFTPSVLIPREDAWAYTPEHLQRVARARAQVRADEMSEWVPNELDSDLRNDPDTAATA